MFTAYLCGQSTGAASRFIFTKLKTAPLESVILYGGQARPQGRRETRLIFKDIHIPDVTDAAEIRSAALRSGAIDPGILRFRVVAYDSKTGSFLNVLLKDVDLDQAVAAVQRTIPARQCRFVLEPMDFIHLDSAQGPAGSPVAVRGAIATRVRKTKARRLFCRQALGMGSLPLTGEQL